MTRNRVAVLLAGRDDWQRDDALNLSLLEELSKEGSFDIAWEDPASESIYWWHRWLPRSFTPPQRLKQINLRFVQLAYGILHPSYFGYLHTRKRGHLPARCIALSKRIRDLSKHQKIIVIARSSGGLATSLIADRLKIERIICLAYPFQHPEEGDSPSRYQHLAEITTPIHIVQGSRDCYGGEEVKEKYSFSDHVSFQFVDTDHNFDVDTSVIQEIVGRIQAITRSVHPGTKATSDDLRRLHYSQLSHVQSNPETE